MALSTSPSHRSLRFPLSSSSSSTSTQPQATVTSCRTTPSNSLPLSPTSSSQGIVGNDRLDPSRLSLNNGIHHGDYIIGPILQPVNGTPVKNISEYIAKKEGTDEFVILKVLTLGGAGGPSETGDHSNEDNQGRMLLYNELSILSLLQDQLGVIHQHGFFCERNYVILVLDCIVGHNYDKKGHYKDLENLQHYVIHQKKLAEREALEIFSSALSTVDALHQKNIVHRDLKLGNMVLNRRTREVILTNFVLSKHLVREGDELVDQRGSLAYVSPDVLSGQPYCGKASDMWAMGVLLYTMIYGQFPFYDSDPQELFRKIKTAKYTIPRDDRVSMATVVLIKEMMEVDPKKRMSAHRALDACHGILSRVSTSSPDNDSAAAQIVPDMEDKQNSSDIPTAMKTEGVPSSSTHFLSTMQLSLNPSHTDSQSTHVPNPVHPVAASQAFPGSQIHVPTSPVHPTGSMPFQGSTVQITTSPVHGGPISFHAAASGRQQLLLNSDLSSAYLLTPLTPSLAGGNYFATPSPPSNSHLSTSPTHSLGSSSSPPVSIPTSPPSSSHSLPLMQNHANGCHRPVGPSQSVDSYFTSRNHHNLSFPPSASSLSSSSTPHHVRPTSLLSSPQQQQHSRSIFLPSVSESGRTPENMAAGSYIVTSPVDSIMTIRSTHPRPEGESNRHSFAGSEAVMASISAANQSGSSRPHAHRRRRNSSGDLNSTRVRRSSQGCRVQSPSAAVEGASLATAVAASNPGRTRRRSQDHMERRRRSASREPYTINPQ